MGIRVRVGAGSVGAGGVLIVALHTHMSICAGIGGLDLGLRLAVPELRTVCYIEREGYAASVLVARMEDQALDQAPVWDDVAAFDGGRWCGCVDIISAGYPCQPFSCAGRRRGSQDPRHLWPHIARIIGEVEPEWIFLENVAGHLRLGFREVRSELRGMGYIIEAGLFTAAEVGAPHIRKRLFVLAHAQGRGEREPHDQTQPIAVGAQAREGLGCGGGGMAHTGCQCGAGGREGGDMVGAAGTVAPEAPERERLRNAPGDGGSDVGDAADPRRSAGRSGEGGALRHRARRQESERRGGGMADAIPAFPPGPQDADAWRRVLEVEPGLEPAFCRVADGVPADVGEPRLRYRPDQLRCLGNAVVPVVAAYAFRVLYRRLSGGDVA